MRVEKIALVNLLVSGNRNYGDEGDLQILAEDMNQNGMINPVTAKPTDSEGVFDVVAGRRRVGAAKLLGWKDVDCNILEGDEINRADEIAIAENVNRLGMHPLDEAVAFKNLMAKGETIEALSKRIDRKVSEIWQRVQLLDLNDGIKEFFRDGKIDLHAAAMLKSLNAEQQQAFVDKSLKKIDISIWDVKTFISKVRHDKLYQCITGKDCAKCTKRTRYSDKALFPELDNEADLCLDHECYMENWQKFLSAEFQAVKAKNKSHEEANIIVCADDDLRKIFGKTVTVDGVEFAVVKTDYYDRPDEKPSKGAKPCFKIDMDEEYIGDAGDDDVEDEEDYENVFSCVPMYWSPLKAAEKRKSQSGTPGRQNPFIPLVRLLDLPQEEAEQTLATLTGKVDVQKDYYTLTNKVGEIERKIKHRVLERLFDIAVKKSDDEKDIDRFLNCFRDGDKDVIKKFLGSDKAPALKKLSVVRIFTALYASTLKTYRLPDFDKFTPGLKNEIAGWVGVPIPKLREMYKEELKPLMMPKPAQGKNPTAKKPAAKAKPAAKKKAPAKGKAKK